MKSIDQNKVYTGVVFAIVAPKEDYKNPSGFINPDDAELREYVASRRVKFCKNPGNINFAVPRYEGDRFYACRTNQFGLQQGQKVEFKVRENDNGGLPQAYDVHRIDTPKAEAPVYVDPIQEKINDLLKEKSLPIIPSACAQAYEVEFADDLPSEEEIEDDSSEGIGEDDYCSEEEIDQNEVDYAVYYDD